ncbi:MAG: type II toxin-antitoxin system VapC family toxin [Methylacidiphilales bacterium]|nr:type II toxin-antitoxin system VapC family toxin [Candidatus Methylacidiphilales bacterium]
MPILVDSNVLLDVITRDPKWFDWSSGQLREWGDRDLLFINPLIFAEVSISYDTLEVLNQAMDRANLFHDELPWEAAFLAGHCFVEYKKRGGKRRSPLPDFYIGAHASIRDYLLLTRDAGRYRTYFPRLRLIAPGN